MRVRAWAREGGAFVLRRWVIACAAVVVYVPGVGFLFGRRRNSLRPLDEAAAYLRCHGDRSEEIVVVRVVKPRPAPVAARRQGGRVSGEQLRQRFEELLDARQKP